MKHANLKSRSSSFASNEDGSATPLAIGFVIIFIVIGGLAVDFNKAMGERTQMQLATDTSAHAALYTWEFNDVPASTEKAIAAIDWMLPAVAFRDALQPTDLEFGFWNLDTGTFTVDPTFEEIYPDDKTTPLRAAVRSNAELEPSRANESRNIFLSMVGQDTFTIRTSTIYSTFYPDCGREGFMADGVVDMQSGSIYLDGFCMHSNEYVSLNQNNFFEPGTVVSMPSLADLDIPSSGFELNEGLQAALRSGEYRLRILTQLPDMFSSLLSGDPEFAGFGSVTAQHDVDYPIDMGTNGNSGNGGLTEEDIVAAVAAAQDLDNPDSTVLDSFPRMDNDFGKKTMVPIQFSPSNRIYRLECSGNGDITFSGGTYSDFVLVTDCPITFANGTILDGVLIATTRDVSTSHLQMGMNDNCAPGGGAGIWTLGSFSAASDLKGYGAQILALGDITFTANASGLEGVSFVAGGMIDGTSNGAMGYCDGQGNENFAEGRYFRMVN